MAATVFTVRQFFALPNYGPSLEGGTPVGTFIVTGSVPLPASALLLNNTRTNLSQDSLTIETNLGPVTFSGTSSFGWFPGPSTATSQYVIIVGGNPDFSNTAADGRAGGSNVSCWGATGSAFTQGAYNTAFIDLAKQIRDEFELQGTYPDFTTLAEAKTFCQSEGFYYQFPVSLEGQSPNTGNGSD
jgi:hypothetical protein